MKTLHDAWRWYESARVNLTRIRRLGARYWNEEALAAPVWQDDWFRQLEAADLVRETTQALRPLEDLGILVLFSVFESAVRDHLAKAIRPESDELVHPILKQAALNVLEGIQQGSLANNVLTPLKAQATVTADLSEKVNQVRHYRNWVAHGKRAPRPPNIVAITALEAFNRLMEFLDAVGIASKPELEEPADLAEVEEEREID
jgi:hypothetical protein